jgi:hypothetical protein
MAAAAPAAKIHLETIRILPTPTPTAPARLILGVNVSWFK